MCGPSLTETSLCGARLYAAPYGRLPFVGRTQAAYSRGAHQDQVLVQNFFDQKDLLSADQRIYCFVFLIKMFRVVTKSTYAVCGPG